MTKILAVATHATDDPTKSSLAFITAVGALGAGKDVGIALLGGSSVFGQSGAGEGCTGCRLSAPVGVD
jgi:predicted peroxiredoxin